MVLRRNLCPAGECDSDPGSFSSVEVPCQSSQTTQCTTSKWCLRRHCEPDCGKSLCTSRGISLFLGPLQRIQHSYVKLQVIFIGADTLNKAISWEKCRFSLISLHQTSVWNKVFLTVDEGVWTHPIQDRVEPGCCLPENVELPLGKAHNPWRRAQKTGAPHKRNKANNQKNASRRETS